MSISPLFDIVDNIQRPALSVQNQQLESFIKPSYSFSELEAIRAFLASKGTLDLFRFGDRRQNGMPGGSAAVTPLFHRGAEAAEISFGSGVGDYLGAYTWDRDSMAQVCAEIAVREDPALSAGTIIDSQQWKRGLMFSLNHHVRDENNFLNIIFSVKDKSEIQQRPHIRVNAVTGKKTQQPWGHDQNDALGAINFVLFWQLASGGLLPSDTQFWDVARAFSCLLHAYFFKIDVANDHDLGAWEYQRGIHWSSVASVAVSLSQQLKFLRKSSSLLTHSSVLESGKMEVWCDAAGTEKLLCQCKEKLAEIGTAEFLGKDHETGVTRTANVAQLGAILMMALANDPVVDLTLILQIVANIERDLMRNIGIIRFVGDGWDGRENRCYDTAVPAGKEAQWCHAAPVISVIYGWFYQLTGDRRFLDLQQYHFNKGLSALSDLFLPAESWIFDEETALWIANANHPLAWAQAMILLSFAWMKKSLMLEAQGQDVQIAPEWRTIL